MRDLKKSKNSLETRKIRKILNEEARLGISPNSESETEEVDLQKELYPLGHYINNREEMIEQMFSIIKGAKLKKMLPPVLKDVPFDELKADCLIHLLGMSKKRIRAILDGREINSSSDSETHSDSSTTPSKKQKVDLKPFIVKQEGCSDISDNSEEVVLVDPDLDFLNLTYDDGKKDSTEEKKKSKRKLKRQDLDNKHKRSKIKVVEQASDSDVVEQIDSSAESASENESGIPPKEGQNLLEILELEMRARAIRALLKNNDTQGNQDPTAAVEEPTQNTTNAKDNSKKKLKEVAAKKVTPAKNFRKKKRKSDDVIVIAPKVVTIDLTDENELPGNKTDKDSSKDKIDLSCSIDESSQGKALDNSDHLDTERNKSSASEKITVVDEELSNTKEESTSGIVTSRCEESTSNSDHLDQTNQSDHAKSSWAQRWLESKEVKKVVSTSKICGNIRKKIKNAKLAKQQKQSQDEPINPSSEPQQQMEGSVVEYELLPSKQQMEGSVVEYELLPSKQKITGSEVEGINNNDTQGSISSANQEPMSVSSETLEPITASSATQEPMSVSSATQEPMSEEGSTADQVQVISSTKGENPPTCMLQSAAPENRTSEENTANIKNPIGADAISEITDKFDTQKELCSSNKEYTNAYCRPSLEICELEVGPVTIEISSENGNGSFKNEVSYADSATISQEKFEDESAESVTLVSVETNKSVDHYTSLSNDENDQENCESSISTGEPAVNKSEVVENEFESNNKNSVESMSENNDLLVDTMNCKNNLNNSDILKVSETLKNEVLGANIKPVQETNEPEALEINITEEDRDIEDVFEENSDQSQLNNAKDSVIVID